MQHQLAGQDIFAFIAFEWHVAQAIADRAEENDDKKKDGNTGKGRRIEDAVIGIFGVGARREVESVTVLSIAIVI